ITVFITRHRFVGRNIQINLSQTIICYCRNCEVTSICRCLFRHSPNVLFYFVQHRNQLRAIICLLNNTCCHDDLCFSIDCYLRVVSLVITSRYGVLHYSRIRVGEITLRITLRNHLSRLGPGPLSLVLLLEYFSPFLCCSFLLLERKFFLSILFGFAIKLCFQLAYSCKPRLGVAQFFWQLISSLPFPVQLVFFLVDLLRFAEQSNHFRLQLFLGFTQPLIGQRCTLGGIRFNLRSVDRHVAQLHKPGSLAQLQHLDEQFPELFQMPLAKLRNAVVIRVLVARQHSKRHVIVSCLLHLARRHLTHAVTVYQELHHHDRMIRRPPTQVALFINAHDLPKVQLL